MKKMRFFILSSLVILSFGFMSCGGGSQDEASKNDSTAVQTKETSSAVNIDLAAGKKVFTEKCMVCHQESGLGVPGTFPPLAKSDYLQADKMRAVKQAIYGSKTPITVNGIKYPGGIMTVFEKELSDQQVLDVVNYVLNSWGNQMGVVTLDDVKTARAAK
jgi:mono/diheme cytochrome c family protein